MFSLSVGLLPVQRFVRSTKRCPCSAGSVYNLMSWCLFSLIYCMPEASFCKKCISHVLLPQQREGGKWHSYLEANLWKLSLPTRGPIQQVLPPFCWGWAAEVERTGRMAVPLILVRNVRKDIFCRCRYTHTTT